MRCPLFLLRITEDDPDAESEHPLTISGAHLEFDDQGRQASILAARLSCRCCNSHQMDMREFYLSIQPGRMVADHSRWENYLSF
jgi:hypothetical protein